MTDCVFILITEGLFCEVIFILKPNSDSSGASIHLHAAAPASDSNERWLKVAVVEDEHDEEDEDDDPVSSERVRRAGGNGSRDFGKS